MMLPNTIFSRVLVLAPALEPLLVADIELTLELKLALVVAVSSVRGASALAPVVPTRLILMEGDVELRPAEGTGMDTGTGMLYPCC